MRKFLKITGLTLLSLVGVVLIAAAVLVYVVFTPSRLTPVVQKVAADYITCEHKIGNVDLTFFSTFPEFGLRADSILIINPTEGAQSDTLLAAKRVVARIELMSLLRNGELNIREVALQEVALNAYMGENGVTNFDIVSLPQDTTPQDTTESEPFIRSVSFEDIRVTLDGKRISLVDRPDSIAANLLQPSIRFSAQKKEQIEGQIRIDMPTLSATYRGVDYATNATIALNLPYQLDLKMQGLDSIEFAALQIADKATLRLNEFTIELAGKAQVIPTIDMDMQLRTGQWWHISDLLAIVPPSVFTMPEGITADGDARLEARVEGTYNDTTWPLVTGVLHLKEATGSYSGLPYTLEEVEGAADFTANLNEGGTTDASLRQLSAKILNSDVSVTGDVNDILGKMMLDLMLQINLQLPDAYYFFPEGLKATGNAKGSLQLKMALDDLTELQLEKGLLAADLKLANIDAAMDSMLIRAPKGNLSFRIPNGRKADTSDKRGVERRKHLGWLEGCLQLTKLEVLEPGSLEANLENPDIDLQLGNILSDDPVIYADVDLTTADLQGTLVMTDSLGAPTPAVVHATSPKVCAYVEYDTKDTTRIPTLSCKFDMARLVADYDTISARLTSPSGSASISGGRRDKTQPRLSAKIAGTDLMAKMGTAVEASTGKFSVAAKAQHTTDTTNILLEWRPKLDFEVQKAVAKLDGLEPQIRIPQIAFSYSNKDFRIDTSRIELGHSDFSLSGEITNIGPWLEKKGLMKGELNFYSSRTDVNELLGYVSGFGNEDANANDTPTAAESQTSESDPFIVPKGVDLALNTHIKEAYAFDQHVRSLNGRVYVKDGVLIIEEMGFICEAARLQLTAMYKTPRRNHIFVGFDYHMLDIDVAELVNMIPQVDSMLPMLRSFKGAAQFHLAAETYVNSKYEIKSSTTRGACSITAKDLTLLDGETFSTIAKLLTFKKQTENKIDSISAEIALYKEQVDIYPFLITCDKWMAAVGGQHNLDMTFDYHVSLLNPFYLGVDVKGNFDDMKIRLAKCKYAKDFKPVFHREVDTQAADIRAMIKRSLEQNVK